MSSASTSNDSSGLLRAIIDSAPLRLFWKDRDSRYLGCNEMFARDAGVSSPAEVIGRTDDDLPWRARAEAYRRDDREVMESGRLRLLYDEEVLDSRGNAIQARTSKVPLRDGDGRVIGVLGFYIDDTKRAAAEHELQISEARFRSLIEQAPFPVQIFGRDGKSRIVNGAWERVWGVPASALHGYNLFDDRQAIETGVVEQVRRAFDGENRVIPPTRYDRAATPEVPNTGGALWLRTVIYPVRDEEGEVHEVVVLHEDVTDRVLHEQAAEEHAREFRTLFDTSPDSIWLLDDSNRFVLANRAAAMSFGYESPSEVISLHPAEISPDLQPDGSSSRDKAEKMIAMARERGTHRFEWMHKRRDGSLVPFEVTLATVTMGREPRLFCVGRDISARKDTERRLRLNRDFLGQIIAGASQGICVYADIDVHPFLRFSVWNDRMTEITGYTMEEMNRIGWFDALFPDPAAMAAALERRKSLTKGQEMHDEMWRIRTKSGEIRTVALSTSPFHETDGRQSVIGMAHDMSAQVAAEEALQRSEQNYRGLFDSSLAAIFVFDPDGRVRDANRAAVEMTGFPREELLQRYVADLDPDWQSSREALRGIFAGRRLVNLEHRVLRKDGTQLTALDSTCPILDADGKVTGVQSTLFDITDWRRSQQEQARLKEQLAATQRLESVGRLAGGVAHDFNNMLSVILGRTSLAMEALPPGDPMLRHLREVMDAGQRSADLTRQLLAFARRQMATPLNVDLNEKIAGLVKMLTRLIGEDIALQFAPGPGLWPVRIDPSQVDQVLANLCLNARDAISGPGRIVIETANDSFEDPDSAGRCEAVCISVKDDGCGMSAEVLANIFEPFYTTKELGKGSGLGLATVYGIVKQNHGHIEVTSNPGEGSEFRVWLPATAGLRLGMDAAAKEADRPQGSETVLLVEDEPAVREMTQLMLESFGYRVLSSPNGPAALALLTEARASRIDLLLTDVIMPEMSGGDLAAVLQQRIPGLKVLFVSGYPDDVIAESGKVDADVAFLQKPFGAAALAAKVREILDS